MIDLRLRFPTHADALSTLRPLGMVYDTEVLDAEGQPTGETEPRIAAGSHQWALDEIGLIAPDPEAWHINLRVIDDEFDASSLEPFVVVPLAPVRVWA